ncbi:MAG: pyridoxal-phosphate dependent enzyme [Erysipelotrichaceae bacterium]|nr:pyridoxal-phosphate dependent enzyme [Erysipelotrichaceae bacterium]
MIYDDILKANGNTPLIKLNKMVTDDMATVYVKYEGVNIGGSIKTRAALGMIEDAEAAGKLKPGMCIVETTSGNQGIALAMVGAVKGYKVIIVMPDSVSEERMRLIKQYGAKIRLVHDENDIGACIKKCYQIVENTAREDENVFVPSQFSNPANVQAQKQVGIEILNDIEIVDGFCSGFGTGGTITGIATVLKEKNPDTYVVAIEPEKAAVLSGKKISSHLQMGIGDGVIPPILNQELIDEIVLVSDEDAIKTSKELALKEGIMAGISSGTNVFVALKLAKKLGKGKTVVTVLPDTGERYFSTPLFD